MFSFYRKLIFATWLRHKLVVFMTLVSISLGVSLVLSMEMALKSAKLAFLQSSQAVVGKATHRIQGLSGPFSAEEYFKLRRAGFTNLAPIVTATVQSKAWDNRSFQLLGVDVFAEDSFRSYTRDKQDKTSFTSFLLEPNTVIISKETADRYQIKKNQRISIFVEGFDAVVRVLDIFDPQDEFQKKISQSIVLADISTVQELTRKNNQLDYVDVVFAKKDVEAEGRLRSLLSPNLELVAANSQVEAATSMTQAFELNLRCLSFFGLLVSSFLVFNSLYFLMSQRRPIVGVMRSMGMTSNNVFVWFTAEAMLLGFLGSILGSILGIPLGSFLLKFVTRTMTDLYYVVDLTEINLAPQIFVQALFLGIFTSLLAALFPAYLFSKEPPRLMTIQNDATAKVHSAALKIFSLGVIFYLLSFVLLKSNESLFSGFFSALFFLIGSVCLIPYLFILLTQVVKSVFIHHTFKILSSQIFASLKVTWIGYASLVVAFSMVISIDQMVASFRSTLNAWLEHTLSGDIYISPKTMGSRRQVPLLDREVVSKIQQVSGKKIKNIFYLRTLMVKTEYGKIQLAGFENPVENQTFRFYRQWEVPAAAQGNVVYVTEPLARKYKLFQTGKKYLQIDTPSGLKSFYISGVVYDYGNEQGMIYLPLKTYRQYFNDDGVNAIALKLTNAHEIDEVIDILLRTTRFEQVLDIRSNSDLKKEAVMVFDRTFLVTHALSILSFMIAAIGMLTALLCKIAGSIRDYAAYRVLGMTKLQVSRLIFYEGVWGCLVAILISLPVGFVMSYFMINVINLRAFGWTIQFVPSVSHFVVNAGICFFTVMISMIYPVRLIYHLNPRELFLDR